MKKVFLFLMLFSIIFSGCSKDREFSEQPVINPIEDDNSQRHEYDEAIAALKKFDLSYENRDKVSSRSASLDIDLSKLNITSVKEEVYSFDKDVIIEKIQNSSTSEDVTTRSSLVSDLNPDNINSEIKIYTIEFEKEGDNGFAIVTGDERMSDGIYAYVLKGNLADTSFNIALKQALYKMQYVYANDIVNYYSNPDMATKASNEYVLDVSRITGLKWASGAPYNRGLPYCPSLGGNISSSSVAVACAQALAFLSPPNMQSAYSLETIKYIESFPAYGSGQTYDELARFYANICLLTETSFDCNNLVSSSAIKNITNDLTYWNIGHTYKQDANVDLSSIAYNLYNNLPHITCGFTKNPRNGHAWLWEGIYCSYSSIDHSKKKVNLTNTIKLKLYCNWGWDGSCDGLFADFETPYAGSKTYLDDNCQIYITSIPYYNSDVSSRRSVRTYSL